MKKKKPKKYYYKFSEGGKCLEKCNVKRNHKIGCVACDRCKYCIDRNNTEKWIICKKIKEAIIKTKTKGKL